MKPSRALATGFVVAAVIAATGIVLAMIPAADGSYIGCYGKIGGLLRVVDTAGQCTRLETPISWNQKGDKGEKGDKGDAGTIGLQGPQGAQGPAGDTGARSGVVDLTVGTEFQISLPSWGGEAAFLCRKDFTGQHRDLITQSWLTLLSDGDVPMRLWTTGGYVEGEPHPAWAPANEEAPYGVLEFRAVRGDKTLWVHAMVNVTPSGCSASFTVQEMQNS